MLTTISQWLQIAAATHKADPSQALNANLFRTIADPAVLAPLGLNAEWSVVVDLMNAEGGPVLFAVLIHNNRIVCTSKPSYALGQLELRFDQHWYAVQLVARQ